MSSSPHPPHAGLNLAQYLGLVFIAALGLLGLHFGLRSSQGLIEPLIQPPQLDLSDGLLDVQEEAGGFLLM